jgi:uncharacterized RDD family membrane protein YckC
VVEACPNHAERTFQLQRCSRCGGSFCPDCLVSYRGGLYDANCKEAVLRDQTARTGELIAGALWRRTAAIVVDLLILYIPIRWATYAVFRLFEMRWSLKGAPVWTFAALNWLPVAIMILLYDGILVSRFRGSTVGKELFALRIVPVEGPSISPMRAWVRAAIKALFMLTPIPTLLDAPMVFSPQRRTLHDRLAGTWVVDARSLPESRDDSRRPKV